MSNQVFSNEIHRYPVITDNVITNDIEVNNIYISDSTTPINKYEEVTLSGLVSGPWAISLACTMKLVKLNNIVTITQNANVTALQNSSTFITFSQNVPVSFRPTNPANIFGFLFVADNSVTSAGNIVLDAATGQIRIFKNVNTNFGGTGAAAFLPFSISYALT